MSIYKIKKVPECEVDKLVEFIDKHWKKGHALTKSRTLLDFQHFNKQEGCYNFIVAENNETKEYDAIVGFIPISQYDQNLEQEGDYWGAIWKMRDDVTNDEINNAAFYIWRCIFKQPFFHSYSAIGISNIAKRIYEVSRIPVDYLRHYYIANNSIKKFVIGKNLLKKNIGREKCDTIKEIDLESVKDGMIESKYQPKKTVRYFINRYLNHPIYKYVFWAVYGENQLNAIFAVRKVEVQDSCVLRIVDVLGDLAKVGNIYKSIQSFLEKENAEYVDLLNYGIEESVFELMGFQKLNLQGKDTIVPNYFEPFEQINVKIEVAYKSDHPYVVFKGDSDQDRPNIL